MLLPNSMPRAFFTLLLLHSLTSLVLSSPGELDKRLKCNQDNCLRALSAHKTQAATFCPAYLSSTVKPTATYTSVCTENPTAVSTACSCFQSSQAASTSTKTPTTTPTPLPTQCSAANNYGYAYDYNTFAFKSQYIYFNGVYSYGKPGDCCARCAATPGCYSFSEIYSTTDAAYDHWCEIGTVGSGTWPDVSKQCPLGKATGPLAGHLSPEPKGAMSGANLGPCGAG